MSAVTWRSPVTKKKFPQSATGAIASWECVRGRSPHQEDPTLTLPLPRGGDRMCS
ncbi:hypothetical protein NG799_13990 [Laspinema sp. D1]|uniref:Uncharacterized protein n=1 Tax=Laspinema palackyanum D2a TaxID=2953684 RepID=A0ABT2MVL2_9CYAN|nr:hypothetical protein [Laspinema sp. D2a]